jgi:hypothetical protein
MRRLISSASLCAFLMANPFHVATAQTIVKEQTVKLTASQIFDQFKKDVFVNGMELELATGTMVDKIVDHKITTGELQAYVAKNSSKESFAKFDKMLNVAISDVDSLQDLGEEELSFILQNTMEATYTTGANFMSCAAGLGVGVPLIAVGVILGLSALANATASKEVVTQDYLTKKQQLATDYYNTIADLELEMTTYESDIIYYQDEIEELQRRIDSGLYSTADVEEMHQLIRDYEFYITDAQALIGEVEVDLNYFHNQYAADSDIMSQEEISALAQVDEKRAKAGKQAIAAGVIGSVGAVFTALGSPDCN